MKWGHIISDVVGFYFKFGLVCYAYFAAKLFIKQTRPSVNPPFAKRIVGYLQCVAIVAFIALVASGRTGREGFSLDYNFGATVFIGLLLPVLFGVAHGYVTGERFSGD